MSEFQLGLESELSHDYITAVQFYENALKAGERTPIDLYINLAFLYWTFATQLPFSPLVPDNLSVLGVTRHSIILQEALTSFPESAELHFWERYFPHRGLFQEFTQGDCENILEKYEKSESVVPYFFLWLFDKECYKDKRAQLLTQSEELPTAKNRYIKSVLETNSQVPK